MVTTRSQTSPDKIRNGGVPEENGKKEFLIGTAISGD